MMAHTFKMDILIISILLEEAGRINEVELGDL